MDDIRVVVADDHPFFRDGLRALIDSAPDMVLVGESATGDDVVVLSNSVQPDVILMDLKMPGLNGIEATRKIMEASPQVGIVVVTMFEDDESIFAAMRAGARGYLLKGADREDMLRAIRAIHRGEAIFGPAIAERLMKYFAAPSAPQESEAFPDLTEREREILGLIAQGMSNQEIARTLFLSLKTVQNYVSSIFSKLQVADRVEAVLRAREAGLGRLHARGSIYSDRIDT